MFSEKLKALRKKSGLTQEQLAEKLSVSRQAIAKWENNLGMPDVDNLKNIALFFGVSVDYLVGTVTDKDISLAQKFHYAEMFGAGLGILLGIAAQNFEFGFVMTLLIPSLIFAIEKIVLDISYQKKQESALQMENIKSVLPKNWYGRTLDTSLTKDGRFKRIKSYLWEALSFASVMTMLDITAQIFGTDEMLIFEFTGNDSVNSILSCAIAFALMLVISFVVSAICGELAVIKYNKIK